MDSSNLSDFAALSFFSTMVLIGLAICLVPAIFYLLTLQKALNRVAPERRTMNPPMVWLLLIPLFNLVWSFLVVSALSKSLDAELSSRIIPHEAQPGQTIGYVWAGLWAASIVPGINVLAWLPALVLWIVYWVKIAGFSAKLQ